MEKRIEVVDGVRIAHIHCEEACVFDERSALDFLVSVSFNDDCKRIAINKETFSEDFFMLSTGVAGAILQKIVNYQLKLAIVGDFSGYTSKALRDFIRECNRGNAVFFVGTDDEVTEKLAK